MGNQDIRLETTKAEGKQKYLWGNQNTWRKTVTDEGKPEKIMENQRKNYGKPEYLKGNLDLFSLFFKGIAGGYRQGV